MVADIPGATSDTYTLAEGDEGKAVSVTVSFTDDAGNEESLTSAVTDAVEPEAQQPGHRNACHHRDRPGGRDAHGGNVGHRR